MNRTYKLIFSAAVFSLSVTAFAAELPPINKVIDTAKTINQEIQNKINTSPVAQEISRELPTKEQASGFFAGVWRIIWAVIKFIGGIFDWILKAIMSIITPILQKVGLGFFTN